MNAAPSLRRTLQSLIASEISQALGSRKTGWLRWLCGWLFAIATRRFARFFAEADEEVGRTGMSGGCRRLLSDFNVNLRARGVEHLPREAPLLIVASHPGAYDSIALASCVPRSDLKIFVYAVPFFRALPRVNDHFIYATDDRVERMVSLRASIRHLREGGSLLIFGTGTIEPDPALAPGAFAAIARWSPSIAIILRRVPEVRLVLAIASGVMMPAFTHHPLMYVRRHPVDRRRVAEFLQVITQLTVPGIARADVCVSFAPSITPAELEDERAGGNYMQVIRTRARRLLLDHLAAWYPSRRTRENPPSAS